jgi:hypothetical protein
MPPIRVLHEAGIRRFAPEALRKRLRPLRSRLRELTARRLSSAS